VYATSTTAPTNAGSYTVSATLVNANYELAAGSDPTTATLTVNKATATITFTAADLTQTFNTTPRVVGYTTNPTPLTGVTVTYTGIAPTVYATSTTAPTNAGSYTVSATLVNANYQLAAGSDPTTATLTVNKADQVITITTSAPGSKTYGDSFTVAANGGGSGNPVTFGSDGSCSNLDATFTMTSGTGVCTVKYNQAGNGNYNPAPQKTETVTAAKKALTVKANNKAITYGQGTPAFDVTYTGGFVGTDSATSLGGTLVFNFAGMPPTSYGPSTTAPTNAGGYAVRPSGYTSDNYSFTYQSGTFTISKAALTITASSPDPIIVGSAVPTITPDYSGFVNGETPQGALTTVPTCGTTYVVGSPVNTYPTTCSGAAAPNYEITYVPGTFKVIFGWTGFLQPINDTAHQIGATQSKFKAGQTIPAKFVLRNAAGNVVQQVGEPTFTRSANRGVCDATTTVETTDVVAADNVPTYKWDGTQYHYNWSTKNLAPGQYRIFANLQNGQVEWVDICLQK
jgi:hypothetical protein